MPVSWRRIQMFFIIWKKINVLGHETSLKKQTPKKFATSPQTDFAFAAYNN